MFLLRRAICLMLLFVAAWRAGAQPRTNDGLMQPRILLLVDASSSMLEPWNGKASRFETAGNIVTSLMDSIYAVNPGVEFGLRVYGHQSPAQNNDCFDSRQEVMFSKNNLTQMSLRLSSIRPFGVSPIAYSLKEAATNDLVDEARNAYSIILLTDGGESCGGNICDVVKQLIEKKIYFKPYIISLVDYAPLKDQYACLGAYLQAAKPGDIPAAIHTIVDAYRPQLSAPIMAVKVDVPVKKPKDSIIIPRWIPEHSSFQQLTITIPKDNLAAQKVVVPGPMTRRINGTEIPKPEPAAPTWTPLHSEMAALPVKPLRANWPVFVYKPSMRAVSATRVSISKPEAEPLPKQEAMPALSALAARVPSVITQKPPGPAFRKQVAVVPLVYSRPEPEVINSLVSRRLFIATRAPAVPRLPQSLPLTTLRLPVIAAVPRDTVVAVKPPPRRDTATRTVIAIHKIDPPKSTVKAPATSTLKPKETSFTKETEDSKETSLSILFTDGRGKFYASTPQLQLIDAQTGKLVKQFYRTVDADGNPDPQVIPPGTYNLLVAGRANMLMRRVTVEANKKNKVIVRVSNGSLRFEYDGAADRPITEFEALVNIRFEPGPTIRQHCNVELEYPPGNYYIEVNTMPITRFNVDIDFGATSVVYLPEPGFVQFTNTTPKGHVALFHPLGDKFVRFYDMNISGNPASQKLMLKPGVYEAHFTRNAGLPTATEAVEKFNVKSNSLTEIELH